MEIATVQFLQGGKVPDVAVELVNSNMDRYLIWAVYKNKNAVAVMSHGSLALACCCQKHMRSAPFSS